MRLTVALCLSVALVGCGNAVNTEVKGMVGVTVDGSGAPVAVVKACGGSVDRIAVHAARSESQKPDETNAQLLLLSSDEQNKGLFTVPFAGASGWKASAQPQWPADRTYLVSAYNSTKDAQTIAATVPGSKLATLKSHEVITMDGYVMQRNQFDETACP